MVELTPQEIQRALDGQRQALERLIRVHWITIERVISVRLRSMHGQDDVTGLAQSKRDLLHDFWEMMLRNDRRALRRYDPERGKLSTYLRMKAWSFVAERCFRRRLPAVVSFEEEAMEPGLRQDLESRFVAADLVRRLDRQLGDELSYREREVFDAVHRDGLRAKEVARHAGISENAVNQALARARRKVARLASELSSGPLLVANDSSPSPRGGPRTTIN